MRSSTNVDSRETRSASTWNAGNWWGATFGAVAWMLMVAGFATSFGEWPIVSIALASSAIMIGLAAWLWSMRHSISAFRGLMALMIAAAIVLPSTYYAVGYFASAALLTRMTWSNSTLANIVVLGIVPATILRVWYAERAAKLKN